MSHCLLCIANYLLILNAFDSLYAVPYGRYVRSTVRTGPGPAPLARVLARVPARFPGPGSPARVPGPGPGLLEYRISMAWISDLCASKNLGSLCLEYRISMPWTISWISDLYASNIGSLCLEYRISLPWTSNFYARIHIYYKIQEVKTSMKLLSHKWVSNAMTAPNPTPVSKLDKYEINIPSSKLLRNRMSRFLLFDILLFVAVGPWFPNRSWPWAPWTRWNL